MEVRDRIEELRAQLQKIALDKDLTDPIVIAASEKLDKLISEFYRAGNDERRA